jgi:Arc/MetJ-type ribon-helix-helix transcriptional regulator
LFQIVAFIIPLREAINYIITYAQELNGVCAMQRDEATTTISIPTSLARELENRIKGTRFDSISSYCVYVLREFIAETEKREHANSLSKEDEETVKDRLRALGYVE